MGPEPGLALSGPSPICTTGAVQIGASLITVGLPNGTDLVFPAAGRLPRQLATIEAPAADLTL